MIDFSYLVNLPAETIQQFLTESSNYLHTISTNSLSTLESLTSYTQRKLATRTGIKTRGITKHFFNNTKYLIKQIPHKEEQFPTTNDLVKISNQNLL